MSELALEQYKQIVAMLKGQFGDSCQVILYSLDTLSGGASGSVVSFSGTTTNVQLGDHLPQSLINYIAEHGFTNQYGFINKTHPGMVLRSSVQFLYQQPEDRPIGCLCIHHNIIHIRMITSFLETLSRPNSPDEEPDAGPQSDKNGKIYAASNIQGFLDNIISEFLVERLGDTNFAALDKNDKLALIAELDRRGVFLVKGAVNQIAKRMNISKFSIYNYLDEIRAED